MLSRIAKVFLTKTRDEWIKKLLDVDTCVAPVYNFTEVLSDPQILQRQMVIETEHPTLGSIKQMGLPIKLSETPGEIRWPPFVRDHHTEEVLKELGYSGTDVKRLRAKGII
jgi:crotonobetainyl-CoA:carnitine CoA-transferase CaiB-like acyl-CoA transferase